MVPVHHGSRAPQEAELNGQGLITKESTPKRCYKIETGQGNGMIFFFFKQSKSRKKVSRRKKNLQKIETIQCNSIRVELI